MATIYKAKIETNEVAILKGGGSEQHPRDTWMDELNSSTLSNALKTCDKNSGIKIGIVCASEATAKAMIDSFCNEISCGRMPEWKMLVEIGDSHAQLKRMGEGECSAIEIFSPVSKDDFHTRLYHQILYEPCLDPCLVKELGQCERLTFDPAQKARGKTLYEF